MDINVTLTLGGTNGHSHARTIPLSQDTFGGWRLPHPHKPSSGLIEIKFANNGNCVVIDGNGAIINQVQISEHMEGAFRAHRSAEFYRVKKVEEAIHVSQEVARLYWPAEPMIKIETRVLNEQEIQGLSLDQALATINSHARSC